LALLDHGFHRGGSVDGLRPGAGVLAFSVSSWRTASVRALGDSGLGDLNFGVGQVQDRA
jgi:hypothetical protein